MKRGKMIRHRPQKIANTAIVLMADLGQVATGQFIKTQGSRHEYI